MKKILPLFLLAWAVFSCEREENLPSPEDRNTLIIEKIFNGDSKWLITKMEADLEREIADAKSRNWLSLLPECRNDNIYEFGEIGNEAAHISIDENAITCSDKELAFVNDGIFLMFNSDYTKAQVQLDGKAISKLYGMIYDESMDFEDYYHTWEFQEISESKIVIKATIPADQSAGMLEQAANLTLVFERTH